MCVVVQKNLILLGHYICIISWHLCFQVKADVLMSGWTESTKKPKAGCFILDPPLGLRGKAIGFDDTTAWSLQQIIEILVSIYSVQDPPYTVVIFSLSSLHTMQMAIKSDQRLEGSCFTVSSIILVKVRLLLLSIF